MAKTLSTVIGVDLGRYSLKSVQLQKKGGRLAVTHFASQPIDEGLERTPEELGRQLKALIKRMGGHAKACAVAVSSPEAMVRIIDQPETPPEILRDALRLNGMMLLNQDTRDYVLDCDYIPTAQPIQVEFGSQPQKRYLVAGLPREQVDVVGKLVAESGAGSLASIQLAPISIFNAFEFAHPDVFNQQAFFLLDVGHTTSTMLLGSKRELVLIRNIEFGGKTLIDTLCALSGTPAELVLSTLEQDDELMVENARLALNMLTREIGSSIGFFEGRREEAIGQVWISGGLAKSKSALRILSEELHMPCQAWNAIERCEVAVAASQRPQLEADKIDYSVACGAASQLLTA
jgi:Tfp pilus assembly PilM family ATPase